jgi:hypothetical protein
MIATVVVGKDANISRNRAKNWRPRNCSDILTMNLFTLPEKAHNKHQTYTPAAARQWGFKWVTLLTPDSIEHKRMSYSLSQVPG